MNTSFLKLIFVLPSIFFFSACEKSEAPRTYTEVSVDTSEKTASASELPNPHAGMNMDSDMIKNMGSADPHAGFTKEQLAQMLQKQGPQNSSESPITWTVPEIWLEKPATGMRIASFVNKNDANAIDCSIVTLGGGAGGLAPNVIRWLGQLNMTVPPESELENFIEKQEKIDLDDNISALLVDFTSMQTKVGPTTPSMMAAIIDTPNQRIFVKMTGTKEKIMKESKTFKTFVQSIKFRK